MPRTARSQDPDRRLGRALGWAMVISILLHAVAFLYFDAHPLPRLPGAAAGPRNGDSRAARGGGMEEVALAPPAAPAPTPPVEVEPVVETPDADQPVPEDTPEEVPAVALVQGPLSTGGAGPLPDIGAGVGDGTGAGDGGTAASGLRHVSPPRPRNMIMPPVERPDEVRGKEVGVWVFVAADGQVVADSTRLEASTGDRAFDRRLRDYAAAWLFEPAKRDGRAVADWFRYTITM